MMLCDVWRVFSFRCCCLFLDANSQSTSLPVFAASVSLTPAPGDGGVGATESTEMMLGIACWLQVEEMHSLSAAGA